MSNSPVLYAAASSGLGAGAGSFLPGIRIDALQYLHRTVFPRAWAGTARIFRHVSVGHMIRSPDSALARASDIEGWYRPPPAHA